MPKVKLHRTPITTKQVELIVKLAVDLNLDRLVRNAHISDIVGRDIKYVDELSLAEGIQVIDKLLDWYTGKEKLKSEL